MNESTRLEEMLDAVRVPRIGDGRPRASGLERLIADRGYSCPLWRRLLRRRGIPHAIPERKDSTSAVGVDHQGS